MNPFDLMKSLKEAQSQMESLKGELKDTVATGSAGGNIVQVKINGQFEVLEVKIDPIAVDPRDVQMLEDLIVAAHHDAMAKMQEQIHEKTAPLLKGFKLYGAEK